eukprot:GHVH01006537.1.p1 GENE.GHVH01006537.1~~GHVH01006537.1.p1  ORF type:complete len:405 (+),score=81.82 GHVH01006537.1:213-1427(+)
MDIALDALMILPMIMGGSSRDYAADFQAQTGALTDAIRAGDTATMDAVSDNWNRKLAMVQTSLSASQQYLADELAEYDNMDKAAVDAAVAEEVAKNKEKLNAVMLEKANAQAKLELSKQVGELNQSLAESMTALKKETAQMTADERAVAYQQALVTSKMNFEQVRSTQKEYNAKILKNREDQFNQLMSTYFNLSNKNEEERQETLKRIEHEKDRYMSEVKMSMEKSAENDELFMNLMKAKNSNAQNMMDRAEALYTNDVDFLQQDEDMQNFIQSMADSSLSKMEIERDKQSDMAVSQMQLLSEQMTLDQEAKMVGIQSDSESERMAIQSDSASKMVMMENENVDKQRKMEQDMAKREREENAKMRSHNVGSRPRSVYASEPESESSKHNLCALAILPFVTAFVL